MASTLQGTSSGVQTTALHPNVALATPRINDTDTRSFNAILTTATQVPGPSHRDVLCKRHYRCRSLTQTPSLQTPLQLRPGTLTQTPKKLRRHTSRTQTPPLQTPINTTAAPQISHTDTSSANTKKPAAPQITHTDASSANAKKLRRHTPLTLATT